MNKFGQLQVLSALLYRDLRFILYSLPARLADTAIIGTIQILAISKLFPLLGFPQSMIAPLFMGIITQIIFTASYTIAFRYVVDLDKTRFINYQLTLPFSKFFLFTEFIIIFMIEIFCINIPLLLLGSIFLADFFSLCQACWWQIIILYFLTTFLCALLFIYLAFNSDYHWFLDNVWPRRLSPLFLLGCGFFTWKKLYFFNWVLGILVLANPFTYVHEGLRTAFLGSSEFLPFWLCLFAIISFILLLIFLLSNAIKQRLDPV